MPVPRPDRPGSPASAGAISEAAERSGGRADASPAATSWRALADAGLDRLSPPEAARVLHELGAERQRFVELLCALSEWPGRSMLGPRLPDPREVDALNALPGRWRVVVLPEDDAALGLGGLAFERVFVLDSLWDCRQTLYGAWHRVGVDPQHVRAVSERALRLLRAGPLLRAGAAALVPDYLPRSWDPFPFPVRADARDVGARRAWSMARALTLVYWADRLDAAIAVAVPEVAAAVVELLRPTALGSVGLPELASLGDVGASREGAWRHLRQLWQQASRGRDGGSLAALGAALARLSDVVPVPRERRWALGFGAETLPMPATVLLRARANRGPHDGSDYGAVRLARAPLCLVPADAAGPGT